mmetsp:Transcript_60015/g.127109  ORF Transcript_60015/g.127109 Transcript_60015/m.127109 type:complete len:933 (-) Transcript_60015:569-3367(-)
MLRWLKGGNNKNDDEVKPTRVNLPGKSTMYYDEEKKRWRERGKEHLEKEEEEDAPPPCMPSTKKKEEAADSKDAPGGEADKDAPSTDDGPGGPAPPTAPPASVASPGLGLMAGPYAHHPFAKAPAGGPSAGGGGAAGITTNPFAPKAGGAIATNPFAPKAAAGKHMNPNAPRAFRNGGEPAQPRERRRPQPKPIQSRASAFGPTSAFPAKAPGAPAPGTDMDPEGGGTLEEPSMQPEGSNGELPPTPSKLSPNMPAYTPSPYGGSRRNSTNSPTGGLLKKPVDMLNADGGREHEGEEANPDEVPKPVNADPEETNAVALAEPEMPKDTFDPEGGALPDDFAPAKVEETPPVQAVDDFDPEGGSFAPPVPVEEAIDRFDPEGGAIEEVAEAPIATPDFDIPPSEGNQETPKLEEEVAPTTEEVAHPEEISPPPSEVDFIAPPANVEDVPPPMSMDFEDLIHPPQPVEEVPTEPRPQEEIQFTPPIEEVEIPKAEVFMSPMAVQAPGNEEELLQMKAELEAKNNEVVLLRGKIGELEQELSHSKNEASMVISNNEEAAFQAAQMHEAALQKASLIEEEAQQKAKTIAEEAALKAKSIEEDAHAQAVIVKEAAAAQSRANFEESEALVKSRTEISGQLAELTAKSNEISMRESALQAREESLKLAEEKVRSSAQLANQSNGGEEFDLPDFMWSCDNLEIMDFVKRLVAENSNLKRQVEQVPGEVSTDKIQMLTKSAATDEDNGESMKSLVVILKQSEERLITSQVLRSLELLTTPVDAGDKVQAFLENGGLEAVTEFLASNQDGDMSMLMHGLGVLWSVSCKKETRNYMLEQSVGQFLVQILAANINEKLVVTRVVSIILNFGAQHLPFSAIPVLAELARKYYSVDSEVYNGALQMLVLKSHAVEARPMMVQSGVMSLPGLASSNWGAWMTRVLG